MKDMLQTTIPLPYLKTKYKRVRENDRKENYAITSSFFLYDPYDQ